ncbi:MAG TPA: hypothetical protein VKM72_08005 [Thermoanaerobaculia bacterium]|nr:hypothetical protein [Thermoanaerobaculia bacterium]
MAQIVFLTLFLGLTLGPQPIELTVTGPVAAVELLLDGAPAGRMAGPPWKGEIDVGPSLVPHELVARGLDDQGAEIARTRQWLNLPRPPAEVDILLENGASGRPVAARLTWQSLTGESPSATRVTFDDKPLAVNPEERIQLPAWDPATSHVLTAELRFSGALTARRDVVFGGRWGEEVSTELTAVAVRLRPGKTLPPPERMEGWFRVAGRPIAAAAVEEGPAELLVIRDLGARKELERMVSAGSLSRPTSFQSQAPRGAATTSSGYRRSELTLEEGDAVRLVWPVEMESTRGAALPAELFDVSRAFEARDGGLLWFLALSLPRSDLPSQQRLADAAAVAGLQALYANRRRAVLLVLSEQPLDASRSNPALVRAYLDAIRVPLVVWALGNPAAPAVSAWGGGAKKVHPIGRMRKAFAELKNGLTSQRIVWVEGRHLPQSIELSAEAAAVVELAR